MYSNVKKRLVLRKSRIIGVGILLILAVVAVLAITQSSKPDYTNCQQANELFLKIKKNASSSPSDYYNAYKDVDTALGKSTECNNGISRSQDEENVDALQFQYSMAIYSYASGEEARAGKFAQKAIDLNDQVSDRARGANMPTQKDLKDAMREIQNGTY